MSISSSQADVYNDFNGLTQLKAKAGGNSDDKQEALGEVARQFETIFLKMMLKSMRDTVPESDLMGGEKTKVYQSMYDDQISLDLTKRGDLGLADMIVQQLGGKASEQAVKAGEGLAHYRQFAGQRIEGALQETAIKPSGENALLTLDKPINSAEEFIQKLWPQAQNAAKELGVDAKVLLAQSALESGWGQHVMKNNEGQSSHNLFGIKASHGWEGKTVRVPTVEYENGIAHKRQATFRAYDSYQESFNDYVQFLKQNPRYQQVLENAGSNEKFVTGLQKAGYATDPKYAVKILTILAGQPFSTLAADVASKTSDLAV